MKIKEGIIIQQIENEFVLVDSGIVEPAFHGMIKLNDTGKTIIEFLIKNNVTESELINEMLKIYSGKPEDIKKAIKAFIKELEKTSILIK